MVFVLDASIALSWLLPEEHSSGTATILERMESQEACVPRIFWYEIRNVLLMAERRNLITPHHTASSIMKVRRLPVHTDDRDKDEKTLMLARTHRLTYYDAVYLELAIRKLCPLATLDKALRTAAEKEKVILLP